jgi:FG-GAP-like repeat/IPT/TIG domain/Secretion system C-terminal sorting domain
MFNQSHQKKSFKILFLGWLVFVISVNSFGQPTISSFSPLSGPVGASVTINGTNFSTTPANNIVFFGAVRANVTAASATSLNVSVPAGATYQPITVSVNGLVAYAARPFIVTFTGGGTIASNTFGTRQDFTTDIRPNAVVLSDFDGDGKSDVATPNNYNTAGSSSVSVLRNTSSTPTISFAAKQDYLTGAVTYAIAAGDIDGDGKPDMVSTSVADGTASIFRNTGSVGNISFAPKVDLSTGNSPFGVCIADIDKDGKPDLVILNSSSQTISIFRNTGSPGTISFAPKIDFPTVLSPQAVIVADLDGDGKTDIIFTNKLSNSFSVYRNTSTPGTISLASRIDIACGSGNEPYGITAADIDGDSKLDVAVAFSNVSSGGGLQLYRNTSTTGVITLTLNSSLTGGPFSNTYYHSAFDDLNGDGKPDIALTVGSAGLTRVYQNNSTTGVFSFGTLSNLINSFAPYGVMMGDLDGDGRTDLVESEFTLEKISVFKNTCGSPIVSTFNPASGNTNTVVTIFGINFLGATAVRFGGVSASSFGIVNANVISATVGSGASGDVEVTNALGSGSLPGFIFTAPPTITSFSPTSAGTGNTVTITGTNFIGSTAVTFGGVAASSFTIVNNTTITAVVGTGASGSVSVTNPFGTGSLAGFVFLPVPIITSFTPTSAGQGTTVTISGTNFTGSTAVTFGGIAASSFIVVNNTTITAVVGAGASGSVSITNSFGSGSLAGFTFIPPPIIISFSPTSSIVGGTVNISGSNFTGATAVTFGAVAASSFIVNSATSITATIGFGASGNVAVTTPGGIGTLAGFTFIPPPVVNSFSPLSGTIGSAVTIQGTGFSTTPANNIVYFGSVKAQVTGSTATSITAMVPVSAGCRAISVTVNTLTALSDRPFIVIFNGGNSVFTPSSYAPRIDFTGGFDPNTVESDDIDGDGKPDLITPDIPFRVLAILRNTSTGGNLSFAPKLEFATSWVPYYVATGDFDGDGKKDIAVTNGSGDRKISVYKNTSTIGSITLATRLDISTVDNPMGITVNDFNGDGRLDIAVWKDNSTVSIFANTTTTPGSISFSDVLNFNVDLFSIAPLWSYDIDGDKKPDILRPDQNGSKVAIFRNTTIGGLVSFAPKVEFVTGLNNTRLACGDLDGDGKPELLTNSDNSSVTILRNLSTVGNISFATKIDLATIKNASNVCLGDMNGDGKTDIVVVPTPLLLATPKTVAIFKNNSSTGTLLFDPSADYLISAIPVASVLDDFTGDSKLDIASGYTPTSILSVIVSQVGSAIPTPTITSFTPTSGATGATITISGTNFTGATAVSFGGVAASSFTIVNATTITAVVATGASGNVSVTTAGGTASLPGFTYIAPPTITSFTPTSGASGATITISGTNFTGATTVSFGGVAATSFTVVNATTITAVVGAGATGSVSVTTPGGTATRAGFTFIPSPTVTSFSPTSASTGITVTISGTNFTGATVVNFGGITASSFTVVNATTITAVVGTGATGSVSVTTTGGTASLAGFTYTVVTAIGDPNRNNSKELLVSPNPASDIILIKHPASTKNSYLKLIDTEGRTIKLVSVGRNLTQTSLSVKGIASGIYKLIWTDDKLTFRRTVMIAPQ